MWYRTVIILIWSLHNLVEASFDLFRYLLLGGQLKPWELHPLVSYTSCMNLNFHLIFSEIVKGGV